MSLPNWWGDWRQNLTPHTGNLLATDLIECTMIVGGLPVNTVITGAQILGAVPAPSVAWGSITGTLSSQTDLNTALSGKASTGAVTGTGITMSTARILGRSTAGTGAIEEITIGTGLTLSAGTLSASGGGLTVGTTAIASGTVGRVLFQGTGNVLQQSANLFWDNTNNRLGIGTASPSASLHTAGSITASGGNARGNFIQPTLVAAANNDILTTLSINPTFTLGAFTGLERYGILVQGDFGTTANGNGGNHLRLLGTNNANTTRLLISNNWAPYMVLTCVGASDTSFNATLRGQNILIAPSGLMISANNAGAVNPTDVALRIFQNKNIAIDSTTDAGYKLDVNGTARVQGKLSVNTPTATSAVMEITSTTQGFLPPRMTNAQMLAIATPAAGLVVYDTTNNKHCGYNGTAWQNFY